MDVAATLSNMGSVHAGEAKYKRALSYYQKSYTIMVRAVGADHRNVGATYNNMSVIYQAMGRFEKAVQYQEKALEVKVRSCRVPRHMAGVQPQPHGS